MVGDGFRSATMQAAWRPEEESDDQASVATMQAACRPAGCGNTTRGAGNLSITLIPPLMRSPTGPDSIR